MCAKNERKVIKTCKWKLVHKANRGVRANILNMRYTCSVCCQRAERKWVKENKSLFNYSRNGSMSTKRMTWKGKCPCLKLMSLVSAEDV